LEIKIKMNKNKKKQKRNKKQIANHFYKIMHLQMGPMHLVNKECKVSSNQIRNRMINLHLMIQQSHNHKINSILRQMKKMEAKIVKVVTKVEIYLEVEQQPQLLVIQKSKVYLIIRITNSLKKKRIKIIVEEHLDQILNLEED